MLFSIHYRRYIGMALLFLIGSPVYTAVDAAAAPRQPLSTEQQLYLDRTLKNIENGVIPLHVAARMNDIFLAQILIDTDADVHARDSDRKTALHFAAQRGHTAIAQLLIAKGAYMNIKDKAMHFTPLHWASSLGHTAMVKLLIDKGADIYIVDTEQDCRTPLFFAMIHDGGYPDIIELFRRAGADPKKEPHILLNQENNLQRLQKKLLYPLNCCIIS